MIQIKRAYEESNPEDGRRILIDRLWPRGLSKAKAKIDLWLKDVSPSKELRQWFGHDPAKFDEFRRRYRAELHDSPEAHEALEELRRAAKAGKVTLIYSAHDEEHNDAVVLKELLEEASGAKKQGGKHP